MLRRCFMLALIASLSTPLFAQAPAGWRMRVDKSTSAEDPDDRPDLHVMSMGNGFHVQGGPAATFWRPDTTASGNYTLKATFNLMKPSGHTNYYGLIFGGNALDGAAQAYTYFLVAQNGTYIIRTRSGETVTDIQGRTANAAVRQPGANGQSANTLEVRVGGDTISYVVNGTVVHSTPKGSTKTDGLVGVRINHLLDVHVTDFAVTKS